MDKFSVVLVDDHLLFAEGMKSVLNSIDEVEAVSVARNGRELFPLLFKIHPDLLLLDLNLEEENGLELIVKIKKEFSSTKIMVLTSYPDPKYVKQAFRNGVDGYMLKNAQKADLVDGIRRVLKGEVFFGKGVNLPNMSTSNPPNGQSAYEADDRFVQKNNLTKREVEILGLIGEAMSNKEIAEQLFISDQTVSVHKKNLMRKLGVNSTASLVKIAFQSRLVR
ncbi:MAG TPA: response regulator transcription factor [Saprospiraceae bacterium]|nr:response regulator transcription factor [Saprospiraceae bacterium]